MTTKQEKKQETMLFAALQKHLCTLAKRPLTARSLLELEQTAKLGRELLAVGKDPTAGPRNGIMSNIDFSATASPNYLTAYSPPAETFGATMLRELMSTLPALNSKETAAGLVEAIALARENNLDDVVDKLRSRLDAILDVPLRNKPLPVRVDNGVAAADPMGLTS